MEPTYETDELADGVCEVTLSLPASKLTQISDLSSKPWKGQYHPASRGSRTQKTAVEKEQMDPKIRQRIVGMLEGMIDLHTKVVAPFHHKYTDESGQIPQTQRRDVLSFWCDLVPPSADVFPTPREIQPSVDHEVRKRLVETAGAGFLRALAYMHQDVTEAFDINSSQAEGFCNRTMWNEKVITLMNILLVNQIIPSALCSEFLNEVNEGELISTFATAAFHKTHGTRLGACLCFELRFTIENAQFKEELEPIWKSLSESTWKKIEFRYLEYQLRRCDLSFSRSEEFQRIAKDFVKGVSTQFEAERLTKVVRSKFSQRLMEVKFNRDGNSRWHGSYLNGKSNSRFVQKYSQRSGKLNSNDKPKEEEEVISIQTLLENLLNYINSPEFHSKSCKIFFEEKIISLKLTYEMIKFVLRNFRNEIDLEGYSKDSRDETLLKKISLFEETIATTSALIYFLGTIIGKYLKMKDTKNEKIEFIKRHIIEGFECLTYPKYFHFIDKNLNLENSERIISKSLSIGFVAEIQSKIDMKTQENKKNTPEFLPIHFQKLPEFERKVSIKCHHEYSNLKATFKSKIEFYQELMGSEDCGFIELMYEVHDWAVNNSELLEAVFFI